MCTSKTALPELIDSPAGTPLAALVIPTHPLENLLNPTSPHDEHTRTAIIQAVTTGWASWTPAEQLRAALAIHHYSSTLSTHEHCDALRDGILRTLGNNEPWLPTLLGILEWNYHTPGVKLRQYHAWQQFQQLDLHHWAGHDPVVWTLAETGAISSVYWALDDRVEVLARVDAAMRQATTHRIPTAIHALTSIILEAAVDIPDGPVGQWGDTLFATWETAIRQSVADRGPEVAFEDTSYLETWDER